MCWMYNKATIQKMIQQLLQLLSIVVLFCSFAGALTVAGLAQNFPSTQNFSLEQNSFAGQKLQRLQRDQFFVLQQSHLKGLDLYSTRHFSQAFSIWYEQTLEGDFLALSLLAVTSTALEATNPKSHPYPVGGMFWQEWLVRLLGKAEGFYVLGKTAELLAETAFKNQEERFQILSRKYFLQSAQAGSSEAMYAVSFVIKRIPEFSLPQKSDSLDIIPKIFYPQSVKEERYWLTYAAVAGNVHAQEKLGGIYRGDYALGISDSKKAQEFFTLAAKQGSFIGALATAEGFLGIDTRLMYPFDLEQGFLYLTLAVRLNNNGDYGAQNSSDEFFGRVISWKDSIFEKNADSEKTDSEKTGQLFTVALEQSRDLYEHIQESRMEIVLNRQARYARACAQLPELQKAYEVQKMLKSR